MRSRSEASPARAELRDALAQPSAVAFACRCVAGCDGARTDGIAFRALDNGFAPCEDSEQLAGICHSLCAEEVSGTALAALETSAPGHREPRGRRERQVLAPTGRQGSRG